MRQKQKSVDRVSIQFSIFITETSTNTITHYYLLGIILQRLKRIVSFVTAVRTSEEEREMKKEAAEEGGAELPVCLTLRAQVNVTDNEIKRESERERWRQTLDIVIDMAKLEERTPAPSSARLFAMICRDQ